MCGGFAESSMRPWGTSCSTRVDLQRSTAWLNQTKNGTPRGVPLNRDAIVVLKEQIGKNERYCFTSI
jgi:integrase